MLGCMLTCLPITPMHAIEGTRVDMSPSRERYRCDASFFSLSVLSAAPNAAPDVRRRMRAGVAEGVRKGDGEGAVVRAGGGSQPAGV